MFYNKCQFNIIRRDAGWILGSSTLGINVFMHPVQEYQATILGIDVARERKRVKRRLAFARVAIWYVNILIVALALLAVVLMFHDEWLKSKPPDGPIFFGLLAIHALGSCFMMLSFLFVPRMALGDYSHGLRSWMQLGAMCLPIYGLFSFAKFSKAMLVKEELHPGSVLFRHRGFSPDKAYCTVVIPFGLYLFLNASVLMVAQFFLPMDRFEMPGVDDLLLRRMILALVAVANAGTGLGLIFRKRWGLRSFFWLFLTYTTIACWASIAYPDPRSANTDHANLNWIGILPALAVFLALYFAMRQAFRPSANSKDAIAAQFD